ncbi:hypothetical protein NQ315_007504 [Exocentrus adspersus]|uniref:GDT1 family protein n=1 Tax=Exocentrus adspersus TaxID=1586481 RepID=A0AAV8W8H8_9CUCU|nr:hypothetical protein NQ315_007504 [Exocentrus adspersus]
MRSKWSTFLNFTLKCCVVLVAYFTLVRAELEPKEEEEVKPTVISNPGSTSGNVVKENVGFIHAFVASLSVILVSEIGDKTFFIAAIMAMRHPRLTVFAGAISALVLMTILSDKKIL